MEFGRNGLYLNRIGRRANHRVIRKNGIKYGINSDIRGFFVVTERDDMLDGRVQRDSFDGVGFRATTSRPMTIVMSILLVGLS